MASGDSCFACGAAAPRGSRFCSGCGADLLRGRSRPRRQLVYGAVVLVLVLLALGLSIVALDTRRTPAAAEQAARRAEAASLQARAAVARLGRSVAALRRENATLAAALRSTAKTANQTAAGLQPLVKRILNSVFTVEAGGRLGSAFVAWADGGDLYLLTANHVVSQLGSPFVDVVRDQRSWSGEVVATDATDDLATIRVSGNPQNAAPLWQRPDRALPRAGDQLLLIGSPYGLEGTVTTGIVSRVTSKVIQTDAAANPGNSGGPALDRSGRIVGILVAGGGENLNFAVPVGRACVRLRRCT